MASPYITTDRTSSEELDLFKLLSKSFNNGSNVPTSTEESVTRVFTPVTQPTKVQRKRGSTHPSAESKIKKQISGRRNSTSHGDQSREALSHEGSDPVSLTKLQSLPKTEVFFFPNGGRN